MAWTTPKTDWIENPKSPMAEDFNRIEENIDFLNTDIETKKGAIVNALNSVGIATLIADTHVQIASKITGAEKTGVSITPSTENQAIPKGIYDTGGGIVVGDADLIPANIKAPEKIFGVVGTVKEALPTPVADVVFSYGARGYDIAPILEKIFNTQGETYITNNLFFIIDSTDDENYVKVTSPEAVPMGKYNEIISPSFQNTTTRTENIRHTCLAVVNSRRLPIEVKFETRDAKQIFLRTFIR